MQTRRWWQHAAAQTHDCVSCLILCPSRTAWLMLLQRRLLFFFFFSPDSLFLTTAATRLLGHSPPKQVEGSLGFCLKWAYKKALGSHTHTHTHKLQGLNGSFYVKTFSRLSAVLHKWTPMCEPAKKQDICYLTSHTPTGSIFTRKHPIQPDTILTLLWFGNIHNRKAITRLCEKCRFCCSNPFGYVIYEMSPTGKGSQASREHYKNVGFYLYVNCW